jgi:hypothetical protein
MQNIDHLESLRGQKRWVLWKNERDKNGRTTKVPKRADGLNASSTDPSTWATHDELTPPPQGMAGVGVALGGGLVGVDLDACLVDGVLEDWADEIVERLNTYCEVSPSGGGIKLLMRAPGDERVNASVQWGEQLTMPDGTAKRRELALYSAGKYFTITERAWRDRPIRTVSADDVQWLSGLIEGIKANKKKPDQAELAPPQIDPSRLLLTLNRDLQRLIRSGAPEGERSDQFHHTVGWLRDSGLSSDQALQLLQAYPAGIAAKYAGRLEQEFQRCWTKVRDTTPVAPDRAVGDLSGVRVLDVISAAELPPASSQEVFDDELIEGILGKSAVACVYGDSNSGKTFMAIDMCAAIAQGVTWMGRHTEPGIVLYLATESPASVKMRLRAYQSHHGVDLRRFFIVPNPVSLFNDEADIQAVLAVAEQVQAKCGSRVAVIVGDTLARLSAGANENSGQDMGVVLKNCDRIREATNATFVLIHHTGKDAAKGMRGWSGMRAHIDTEIEVTADEEAGLRCAEVTKQRDLDSKGQRYGFRLQNVAIGQNKWGRPRTSAVVIQDQAPDRKVKTKNLGKVEAAVLAALLKVGAGIQRKTLVQQLADVTQSTNVYRALRNLVDAGLAHEAAGMVCAAQSARG